MAIISRLQRGTVVYTGTGGTNDYTVHPSTPLPSGWVNRWGYRLEPAAGLYRVEFIGATWTQRDAVTDVFEPRENPGVAEFATGDQISVNAPSEEDFTALITPL